MYIQEGDRGGFAVTTQLTLTELPSKKLITYLSWSYNKGKGDEVDETIRIPTFYATLWPETAFIEQILRFKLAFHT